MSVSASSGLPDTVQDFLALQGEARLDFTMEYLHYLCLKDIGDCQLLLGSLAGGSDRQEIVQNKQETKRYKLFGWIPRYGYLLTFLPFFPVMFLFTGSGGLAFFITAVSETVLRWDIAMDTRN